MGMFQQAAAEYRIALSKMPEAPNLLNGLGIALAMQGKIDDAIALFRQAVKINPQYTDAKNNLNAALAEKQKSNDSVTEGTGN